MKALQYYGAHDIRFTTKAPIPKATKPDDVVIKIAYCGICGSDLHEYEEEIFFQNAKTTGDLISGKKLPQIIGHEFSGVITEIGSNVKNLQIGDHVVCDATGHCADRRDYFTEPENKRRDIPTCQSCQAGITNTCRDINFVGLGVTDGGLADYTVFSQYHLHKVGKQIPLDIAALIEPLSVVWHAIELGDFKSGEDALVLGAGPIGLAALLVLQAKGASNVVVSEPAAGRREQAIKLGGYGFNPIDYGDRAIDELRKLGSKGEGFGYSFDCSGVQQTFTTSVQALKARGTAVNIAIWPHQAVAHYVMDLTLQERKSLGSICYVGEDFEGVIKALETGKLDVEKVRSLITGKVSLKDGVANGFEELINHKEKHIKILISPEI